MMKIKNPARRGENRTDLVDCNRSDFQVLLTNKNCNAQWSVNWNRGEKVEGGGQEEKKKVGLN
jgi:hypothetical protein